MSAFLHSTKFMTVGWLPPITTHAFLSAIVPIVITTCCATFLLGAKHHLPPGPVGLPVLGNALQVTKDAWLVFTEWKKIYGALVYITVGRQGILVLNDHDVAADLLNRRANAYSDRPRWIVANEIMCGGMFSIFTRQSDLWKRTRRAAHDSVNRTAAQSFFPAQQHYALWFAQQILIDPSQWETALRRAMSLTALKFTYGPYAPPHNAVSRFSNFIERIILAATPGVYLVDYFTWMEYLPGMVAKWKRQAQSHFRNDTAYFEGLLKGVWSAVESGSEQSSIATTIVHQLERGNLTFREASWLCGSLCVAGTDTTAGSLMWFMLAMAAHPDVQARARAEIEAVVGRLRVPNFSDRESLPFIDAIVRETLRWRPMVPLGVPHVCSEDNTYRGYFIPAGTICIPNIWAMNHNPEVYGPDFAEFEPSRHLDNNGKLVAHPSCPDGHVTFGFGKRRCVGLHIAQNVMFIYVATILWAMTIEPYRDSAGTPILPSQDQSLFEGLLVRPMNFNVVMRPNFPEVSIVIGGATEAMDTE